MAIQTSTMRDIVAVAYGGSNTTRFAALYTTVPGGTAGTEVTGGSPAYARKALTFSATNPISATVTFDVPAGTTVVGAGIHTLVTGGTYLDGAAVTSQNFASQGTYQLTLTFTVT
jgi:hypothetical protein